MFRIIIVKGKINLTFFEIRFKVNTSSLKIKNKGGIIEMIEKDIKLLPIFGNVIFPYVSTKLTLSENLVRFINPDFSKSSDLNILVFLLTSKIQNPSKLNDFYSKVGTVALVKKIEKMSNRYVVDIEGLFKAEIIDKHLEKNSIGKSVKIKMFLDESVPEKYKVLVENLIKKTKNLLHIVIQKTISVLEKEDQDSKSKDVFNLIFKNLKKRISKIYSLEDLEKIMNLLIQGDTNISIEEKQKLLEERNPISRLYWYIEYLDYSNTILGLGDSFVGSEPEKNSSLSPSENNNENEYNRLNKKYKSIKDKMSKDAQKVAEEDFSKLKNYNMGGLDFATTLTHLEFLLDLPWGRYSKDTADFKKVQKILDEDHYGLNHIKERILEFIAVKRINPSRQGSILCFVGPPGVGKTSLGKSIARALNRKFIRISLGGVSDEAEIRGHRPTYVGALPGRIVQEIKKCGTFNPVFMIDEVDKIDRGIKGDPSSALLEVLDPEQNYSFKDNYLDCSIDLSQIFFICTANTLGSIQKALRDRMEIIFLPGYTESEKLEIAKQFLIPKEKKECLNNLVKINFSDEALFLIIERYTSEAGVRELERKISSLFRKIGKDYLISKKKIKTIKIDERFIKDVLGPPRTFRDRARKTSVGVAIGLAYTSVGGSILFIETEKFNSNQGKKISYTGQLGDVFRESVKVCLSLLRSKYFKKRKLNNVFHIHVPEAAVVKDGPSAGLAILAALYSLISNRKIKPYFAMTGEVSLKGEVLPVGGLREKFIAAERAGIREIICPQGNKADVEEILKQYPEIKKKIHFHFVSNTDQAIKILFK